VVERCIHIADVAGSNPASSTVTKSKILQYGMKKTIEIILAEAEKFLEKQPLDAGHDIEHHKTVHKIAKDILKHIPDKVHKDVVEIASMWHDVVTGSITNKDEIKQQTCTYLETLLKKNGFDTAFIDKTIIAIRYHSFDDIPQNIEGKVLFDADKLAALDIKRWQRVVMAHEQKKMNDDQFRAYIIEGQRWLKTMHDKLHFAYSRQVFASMMQTIVTDKWVKKLTTSLGVEIGA
jgi:HD superfamily phosphodiesterase